MRRALAWIGAAMLAVLLGFEWTAQAPHARHISPVTGIVEADDESSVEGLQIVLMGFADATISEPFFVAERLLDLPSDETRELVFDGTPVTVTVTCEAGQSEPSEIRTHIGQFLSTSDHQQFGMRGAKLPVGDARPLIHVSSELEAMPRFALRAATKIRYDVYARLLRERDVPERLQPAMASARLKEARRRPFDAGFPASERTERDGAARLFDEIHPLGGIVLFVGLWLLLFRRVTLITAATLTLCGALAILSFAARVDCRRQAAWLEAGDVVSREAALGRLSQMRAFAAPAADAIAAHLDDEPDPAVRASALFATVAGDSALQYSAGAIEILERLASDDDPQVQATRELVEGYRRRAGLRVP